MSVKHSLCAVALLTGTLTAGSAGNWCAIAAEAPTPASEVKQTVVKGVVVTPAGMMVPKGAMITVRLDDVSLADAPSVTLGRTEFTPVGKSPYGYALHYDAQHLTAGHRYALHAAIRQNGKLIAISKTANMEAGAVPSDTTVTVESISQPVPQPVAGAWAITEIGTQKVDPAAPAFMVIRADGALSGTGGCNRMMGHVVADATHFTFGPTAGTRMACPGVRMTQEDAVFKAMQTVRAWRREGDRLILSDDHGVAALTLQENQGRTDSGPQTERSRKSP
ncbi:META domain-containing protein [Asaia bogorensis]|uniref:META domain-containing protein n=1 Tax=Asaia bogorensis TaxID=91915 RepID=UPI0013C48F3E|nr:META domain-containing protein [Asaia bogorensis]